MRQCTKCQEFKDLSAFGKDSKRKDGLYPQCKPCAQAAKKESRQGRTPEQVALHREQIKEWRRANPDKVRHTDRKNKLRRAYGITLAEYDRLLESQSGVCAICQGSPGERLLAVDHCHNTNIVRGLLCSNCNTALGLMADDVDRLRKAMNYIEVARIQRLCP